MKIEYCISEEDTRCVKAFFETWSRHEFVASRIRRNVEGERVQPSEGQFWQALATALLTTQQRSGPTSRISRFIHSDPFPLRLDLCRTQHPLGRFVEQTLGSYGGIRFGPTIGRELAENLDRLDGGGWPPLLLRVGGLASDSSVLDERRVARFLAEDLKGVGPKQARNILQLLGLTRFETPLDSRVIKWLSSFGFPVHLSAWSLSDPDYYEFVADGFQALCRAAGILPCVMDAAIFASFDKVARPRESSVAEH